MPIRSKVTDEEVRGIKDKHSKKELRVNNICRQIFQKYNYTPFKYMNFETSLFPKGSSLDDGTDYGIDDIILYKHIPEEDSLKMKQVNPLLDGHPMFNYNNIYYCIDYKSNEFNGGLDSVYVKLMPFEGFKHYETFYRNTDEYRVNAYYRLDRKTAERERKYKKSSKSRIEKYYGNNQLLGSNNATDYFFYLKFHELNDDNETLELVKAYLVPANPLRYQVITILNQILKKGGYDELPFQRGDFYLNHNIVRALRICEETPELIKPEILKPPMDLFRPKPYEKEIHLRIPETYLTPHIKFNSEGDIIN
ncbi:hypothetical protein [Methanobacterium formicicum]|uniref:Uncharacterized protein n=1 Tax=Methanobacterium formicicum TaxID=2162 RepID=A0A0S4FN22_METFO|nr:hypothetical protein [Methanobacterium formicicum]CEL24433.1 hypothetical protein MB9_0790 [Methanobacterium formicicum]